MSLVSEQRGFREPLSRPRYSLRSLLAAMSVLCCLFALMAAMGLFLSAVFLLLLGLVAAHVLGNSLGTRLRDEATRLVAEECANRPTLPAGPIRLNVAAPNQLTQRIKLKRITLLTTVGGALVGAELGGIGLSAIHPQASAAAVALGVISSGVLGGFAGFLSSSFLSVVRQALTEAHLGAGAPARENVLCETSSRDAVLRDAVPRGL